MASPNQPTPPNTPNPPTTDARWRRLVDWFVLRRVPITGAIFLVLIVEDLFEGVRPHDLADVHDAKAMFGLGSLFAGLGLRSWAAGVLHKLTQLTESGPYAMIRHPLYVGSFLMALGFCMLIDDTENIWFVLGPISLLYLFGVVHEERNLSGRFGERWHKYVRSTPPFVPRWLPKNGFADWKYNQWVKNREYRAAGAALLGLIALKAWRMQ